MIFRSKQVNLDKMPFVDGQTGVRFERQNALTGAYHFLPRPEFETTRDPLPWQNGPLSWVRSYRQMDENWVWAPRRERFDNPVNRALEAFRNSQSGAQFWLDWRLRPAHVRQTIWTAEEVEHAKRVLTRLVGWKAPNRVLETFYAEAEVRDQETITYYLESMMAIVPGLPLEEYVQACKVLTEMTPEEQS